MADTPLETGGHVGLSVPAAKPHEQGAGFPVSSRRLSQHALMAERGKPVEFRSLFGWSGQPIVRKAYDSAGKGGSKKRMPRCNGGDTGCTIITRCKTRHESEPTSNWSEMAREVEELELERLVNDKTLWSNANDREAANSCFDWCSPNVSQSG